MTFCRLALSVSMTCTGAWQGLHRCSRIYNFAEIVNWHGALITCLVDVTSCCSKQTCIPKNEQCFLQGSRHPEVVGVQRSSPDLTNFKDQQTFSVVHKSFQVAERPLPAKPALFPASSRVAIAASMLALCERDVLQPRSVSVTDAKISSTAPDVVIFLLKKSNAAAVLTPECLGCGARAFARRRKIDTRPASLPRL